MTTRFPNGISTADQSQLFSEYIGSDPTKVHQYFNDFDRFRGSDWINTTVGSGSAGIFDAFGAGDGGQMFLSNSAADNDSIFLNKIGESFLFEVGKKLWFEAEFLITQIIESDWIMGLQITDTTPLSVSDGVFFRKNDDTSNIDFIVVKDNVETIISVFDIPITAAAPTIKTSFAYDGVDKITIFINGDKVAQVGVENLPDDELLTFSFGIKNGSAVGVSAIVDYVFVAKER